MELKKSPSADLNRNKGLFYQIGLIVTLLLMIGVFSWSRTEKQLISVSGPAVFIPTELPPLAIPEQKPQTAVAPIALSPVVINIVDNSREISHRMDFSEFTEEAIVVPPVTTVETIRQEEEIFITAEKMPTFRGGELAEFRRWVMSRIVYPDVAAQNGVQGRVVIAFVIEKDGSLTGIEIVQSPDSSLAREAERVLGQSPRWEPGKQRNTPVRVKFTMPVEFQLH